MNPIIEYVSERFHEDGVRITFFPANIRSAYSTPTRMDDRAYMLLGEPYLNKVLDTAINITEFSECLVKRIFCEIVYYGDKSRINIEFTSLLDDDQVQLMEELSSLGLYLDS